MAVVVISRVCFVLSVNSPSPPHSPRPGYYCPLASTAPTPCPPGRFGSSPGLSLPNCTGLCG